MTRAELEGLKQEKVYFTAKDIAQIFDCCDSKAYGIIQAIKQNCNSLSIRGKVTVPQFDAWYNQQQAK